MSGLGHLYLLGDACSPKRNLTWATHWLDGAAAQWQPDALAMLGFLAESRALPRLYNYTLHDPASVLVPGAGSVSGSASNSVSASNSPAAKSGRALYEAAVSSGGSVLASMALGWKHANGVDVPVSCPAAAAHYEAAAIAAVAALDRRRQQVQDY
jgi:TPR repeat protein